MKTDNDFGNLSQTFIEAINRVQKTNPAYAGALCDQANASREYEAAHKIWMNTVVWSPEAVGVRARLDAARTTETQARERAERLH